MTEDYATVLEVPREFLYYHCPMCGVVRGDCVEPVAFYAYTKHYCYICKREVEERDDYDQAAFDKYVAELNEMKEE